MKKHGRDFQARVLVLFAVAAVLAFSVWLAWSKPAVYRWPLRLYTDHAFMHHIIQRWGVFAPLAFIAIQALQVVIAPIPGDVTGVLGGSHLVSGSDSFIRRSASLSVPCSHFGSADGSGRRSSEG